MKILSVECSAGPASCAILDDGKIIASVFVNTKLTHSQTLMPMIVNMFKSSHTDISDIEKIAVSVGPGSFTGLRIGISAVKGLAAANKIPCIPVSTLEVMAEMFSDQNCIVCAVMDARCNQVYNALFKINDGKITRLCEDRALLCSDLTDEIKNLAANNRVIVCGDGADMFFPYVKDFGALIAPQHLKYQTAIGVGIFACKNSDSTVASDELLPVYLRLPQAERELMAKNKTNETENKE